jgi:pimeloyl-ACP methyl ester carboxylesterase
MVAQELALARPERVGKLVLACTTPGGPQAFPLPERTAALLTGGGTLREFVENALEPDPRPELVDRILEHRVATAQAPEAWAAQAAAGAAFDAHDRVGAIAAPTLVLHGDGDVVVDPRNAELLAGLLPDARVERFPGCGHLFFWQEPERFVRTVEDFLC